MFTKIKSSFSKVVFVLWMSVIGCNTVNAVQQRSGSVAAEVGPSIGHASTEPINQEEPSRMFMNSWTVGENYSLWDT